MIRDFLNKHWKPLIFFALLAGLAGWILWGWTAYDAWTATPIYGEWIIQLDFNAIGEGPYELFGVIPGIILLIVTALYVFYEKMGA